MTSNTTQAAIAFLGKEVSKLALGNRLTYNTFVRGSGIFLSLLCPITRTSLCDLLVLRLLLGSNPQWWPRECLRIFHRRICKKLTIVALGGVTYLIEMQVLPTPMSPSSTIL